MLITIVLFVSHIAAFVAGAICFQRDAEAIDKDIHAVTTGMGTLEKARDEIEADL